MGILIPWPPKEDRAPRPSPGADEPRGRILFFLGVRYERHPEPGEAEEAARPRPGPQRKQRGG